MKFAIESTVLNHNPSLVEFGMEWYCHRYSESDLGGEAVGGAGEQKVGE